MNSPRSRIIELVKQGCISAEKIDDALVAVKVTPENRAWRVFIDSLLLWMGALCLAFAVMFFIAYNWDDIGRFAKFGMVEGLMVLALVFFWKRGYNSIAANVSLLVATLLLGALLALYGQTYQTGADPWQLFFTWALLMLPWTIISRFPTLWVTWLALVNLSVLLYYQSSRGAVLDPFDSGIASLWAVFFLNVFSLSVWEYSANYLLWLSERWAIRMLAAGSGAPIAWLVFHGIFDKGSNGGLAGVAWVAWVVGFYYTYRRLKPDLFMLAGVCLSIIVVVVSFVGKLILEDASAGGFLVLTMLVIGLGTGAAVWLRSIDKEGSHESAS